MAKKANSTRNAVRKKTAQGGPIPRLSTMKKSKRNSFKAYRGQGK